MTELTEIHVNDLSGLALDWATAKALKLNVVALPIERNQYALAAISKDDAGQITTKPCNYSTDWQLTGQLLDQFYFDYRAIRAPGDIYYVAFVQNGKRSSNHCKSKTSQEAICKALVYEFLGSRISVPKELIQRAA